MFSIPTGAFLQQLDIYFFPLLIKSASFDYLHTISLMKKNINERTEISVKNQANISVKITADFLIFILLLAHDNNDIETDIIVSKYPTFEVIRV
jgi:hypothetical protein